MSKDKDNESEDKIGTNIYSEAMNDLYLLFFSVRGGPGRVRPPDGDRLHPPYLRHHALLPLVRGQGGAGDDTKHLTNILNFDFC